MGVPGLACTGPGILDLGGVLTEDGGLRGRGGLTGGLSTLDLGPRLGYGGDIFCLINIPLFGQLNYKVIC